MKNPTQDLFFIQQLLDAKQNLPEIARRTRLSIDVVVDKMIEMHHAEIHDLVFWVEENVNSKALFKGVEYFKNVKRPTILECTSVLGLNEPTAKICQFYVSTFKSQPQ